MKRIVAIVLLASALPCRAQAPAPPTDGSLPRVSRNVQGTGLPGLDGAGCSDADRAACVALFIRNAPKLDSKVDGVSDRATVRVDLQPTGAGGVPTDVVGNIWGLADVPPGDAWWVWDIYAELHNHAAAGTNAQDVATAGHAFMEGSSLVSTTWGGFFACDDLTGIARPDGTVCRGIEANAGTFGLNGGADPNQSRMIIDAEGTGLAGTHVAVGLRLGMQAAGAVLDNGILFQPIGGFGIGINLRGNRFATAQIEGVGWRVDPVGAVTASGYSETLRTPASSSAPCTRGEFTDDENFHYVCVAPNRWKRVALSRF